MTNLQEWLKELGLQQYAGILSENDIDFEVLSDLSENDLEKLGISFGHRRKLLKAIAALQPAPNKSQPATQEAERRQVTVLFSDLVGSTALANAIDPEDMSALIQRYQEVCAGAIARFDGFIAKFLGDGVLAYFGYPQAQEDAAQRAVYAGLAIIDGLGALHAPGGQPMKTRIGVATGLVVIGDIIGSGAAREHSIVGETPNLAARLQSVAEPNSIVVSQSTHRLLVRQFDYENLGEHELKGFAEPVQVWRVVREAAVASRFDAGRAAHKAPFVGRGPEMALLLERWEPARNGEGRVVVISGEAGMGKSRLCDALVERIGPGPYYRVVCQCSAYHVNSALYPVIKQLERAIEFTAEDSAEEKLKKLTNFLGTTDSVSESTIDLFAELLSIPHPRGENTQELSPAQRKAATIAALVHQLLRLAGQKPVLFVLEDAHWIDPTTLEFLTRLIDGLDSARLLVLVTARPEFSSPWTQRSQVTSLALTRLGKTECAELVAGVPNAKALRPALIEDILGKTDGVPLFIEELTKTVVESAGSDQPAVPATLQDSLMARLDHTGPAKEIAQIAAVIGQQFSYALLQTVARGSTMDVESGIARLVEAGLMFAQTRSTEPGYAFKHGLIRDVAYDNLLRARRQQIHERVARAFETEFPSVAENEPELLAQHFSRARVTDAACNYFERAGDRAVARSNFAEAVAHFKAAVGEIEKLNGDQERARRELAVLLKLGPPLTVMLGPQGAEVEKTYEQCRNLAKSLGDETATFKATWGLWLSANVGRKLKEARDRAQELIILGERSPDPDLLLEAFHCRWSTASFRGDIATALADGIEGIARYDPARHSWMASVFGGHDPGVCAHAVHALALCQTGLIREAHEAIARALSLAEQLNHPHSVAHALNNATNMCQMAHDYQALGLHAQRLIEIAGKYNFPPIRAHALIMSGSSRAIGEGDAEGLAVVEAEFPRASAIGPMFRIYGGVLGEARLRFGKILEALDVLQWAIGTVTEPGVGLYVPELYRLKGLCLLRLDSCHHEEAMNSLQTAFDIAHQQGATLFQLRAAIDLANATRSTRGGEKYLKLLRETCVNLPEQFDAALLGEAKRLLSTKP